MNKQKLFALLLALVQLGWAADQTKLGAGNDIAVQIGTASPFVERAVRIIRENVRHIKDDKIREATLDAIRNPLTCVAHRVRVNEDVKSTILRKLTEEGLLPESSDAETGVFPPLKNDGSDCPQLPLNLDSAPGSGFGGHHSYPGGLAVHEAFNLQAAKNFAALYREMYGKDLLIDEDLVMAAPAWHDWAKAMVLQWNVDGDEFTEFNFGGTGRADNDGAPGDSRTPAHHILGLAETMARGLPPGLVITQASAHAAPTLGNEYKVVNWLRAAAILARVDPAAKGYLIIGKDRRWRLPPLNHLWAGVDLNKNGQTNQLVEYQINNLSDADFVESIPAVSISELLLRTVSKQFGYDPSDKASYNNKFRNVVLAQIGAERLALLYSSYGLEAVVNEISQLEAQKLRTNPEKPPR
jgi:hypothetical protein